VKVVHQRCAGLDVHKNEVVACARVAGDGPVQQEVHRFATTTTGLLALSAWLESYGATHVVMEATGVYWKPVWHVLEAAFELVLANAAHVRNVPCAGKPHAAFDEADAGNGVTGRNEAPAAGRKPSANSNSLSPTTTVPVFDPTDEGGLGTDAMARLFRHRQTKGPGRDKLRLWWNEPVLYSTLSPGLQT
jgi:hypothetical protein